MTARRCNTGFTLIELLIVIAIIGLLSSVVLVSLNTARTKASQVSLKESFVSIGKDMELFFADNASYIGACNPGSVVMNTLTKVANQYGIQPAVMGCEASYFYMVYIQLPDGTYYCIDSSGGAYTAKITTIAPSGFSCT